MAPSFDKMLVYSLFSANGKLPDFLFTRFSVTRGLFGSESRTLEDNAPCRRTRLRYCEVVAGIVGSYLHDYHHGNGWPLGRLIYIEIVAGMSLLLALLWLLPFSGGFFHWPMDIFLSVAWFAAFALLVQWLDKSSGACAGDTFDWNQISFHGFCGRYRSAEAFSFLSALFWLVSALVGLWFIHREGRKQTVVAAPVAEGGRRRGPWHRRSRV